MRKLHDGIEVLIYHFLTGDLTPEERMKLDEWLALPGHADLFRRICEKERLLQGTLRYDSYDKEDAWRRLERQLREARVTEVGNVGRRRIGKRWWWAASLVVPLCVAAWLLTNREEKPLALAENGRTEIVPAMSGARMLLPSGEVVDLTNEGEGDLIFQDGKLVQEADGVMAYVGDTLGQEVRYNEVQTPRGCEYQIKLPDGTMVWLNAASSLRFPSVFAGDCRRVYATGELYFEVARDEDKPFIVELEDGYSVRVLGTEFNLRSYEREPRTTTLLEGQVRVGGPAGQVVLKPGQQAVDLKDGKELFVREVDVNSVVAWRRGVFLFENARLEDIMEEIGRWYDVEVFFENSAIRDERFSVEMRRHDSFAEVLKLIERTGMVKISINQNNVFVK